MTALAEPCETRRSLSTDKAIPRSVDSSCSYAQHLISRQLRLDTKLDYFLLEHLNSGHHVPCETLQTPVTDAVLLEPPIREEAPFDRVHCLTLVNIEDQLLGPRYIRLLGLFPQTYAVQENDTRNAQKHTHIRLEAYQASLDDLTTEGEPVYAAVSYVCGDQTPVKQIRCGRKSIGVPKNVYDALVHLRLSDRVRLIWVDYLCIKQGDDREKSRQVRMLHRIYAQAHVVSWLGTGHSLDLQSLSFYVHLLAHLWTRTLRNDATHRMTGGEIMLSAARKFDKHLAGQETTTFRRYSRQTLTSLFTTGYFDRLWIAQEIILGKSNTCQIGDTSYSIAVLAAALQVICGLNTTRPTIFNPESAAGEIRKLELDLTFYLEPALHNRWESTRYFFAQPYDLDVVVRLNDRCCSDPRDHIYGVASLFKDADAYVVDYTLSVPEVFADFTVHCMRIQRDLSVFNNKRITMGRIDIEDPLRPDLPSWCPDWSAAGDESNDMLLTHKYSDCVEWRASDVKKLVHSRPTKLALSLRGIAVSKLKSCYSSLLDWVDYGAPSGTRLIWMENNTSLGAFLESQGFQINYRSKDIVLDIFDRLLIPTTINATTYTDFSEEMCSVFDQVNTADHLRALLIPVYLARVEPNLFAAAGFEIDPRIPRDDLAGIEYTVSQAICHWSSLMRLFATEDGMYGTGYPGVQDGDLVCIIFGSLMPQILRPTSGDGHYFLIGECHVDGLMFGEGLGMGLPEQDFILI